MHVSIHVDFHVAPFRDCMYQKYIKISCIHFRVSSLYLHNLASFSRWCFEPTSEKKNMSQNWQYSPIERGVKMKTPVNNHWKTTLTFCSLSFFQGLQKHPQKSLRLQTAESCTCQKIWPRSRGVLLTRENPSGEFDQLETQSTSPGIKSHHGILFVIFAPSIVGKNMEKN